MKAIVDQTLGDVVDGDAGSGFQRAQIDDALMGDHAVATGIKHRVVIFEARGDVVGGEDRDHGRTPQASGTHHRDIRPGDTQDTGRSPGCGRHRAYGARRPGGGVDAAYYRVIGQIGREMRFHAYRPHAGAAAAVRNGEGLVQVDVHHIGADLGRTTDADQRIEIGAVQVDLPTVGVHDCADLDDRGLEYAVGRGVGDHETGQSRRMRGSLGAQIVDVHIAALIALHHHHGQSGHRCAGGIGAVRRSRDQTHLAGVFAAHFVEFSDHQQARVFALRSGIRLQ